jgi:hypothetical protein
MACKRSSVRSRLAPSLAPCGSLAGSSLSQASWFCQRAGSFYRRCTAVERVLRSVLQESGPSFATGLHVRPGPGCSDSLGGAAQSRTICIRGLLANLAQEPTQTYERERSGGSTRRVRSHAASLYSYGQARFAAPSGRALPHRRGRDRRVLAGARATGCCTPSRSATSGTGPRGSSSGAAARERATRVRPLRRAFGGATIAARRLAASLTFGGVR